MTFEKTLKSAVVTLFIEGNKIYFNECCESNALEATYIRSKLADKVEKLNVNEHVFCVKKGKF